MAKINLSIMLPATKAAKAQMQHMKPHFGDNAHIQSLIEVRKQIQDLRVDPVNAIYHKVNNEIAHYNRVRNTDISNVSKTEIKGYLDFAKEAHMTLNPDELTQDIISQQINRDEEGYYINNIRSEAQVNELKKALGRTGLSGLYSDEDLKYGLTPADMDVLFKQWSREALAMGLTLSQYAFGSN